MATIAHVAQAMETVLTMVADQLARTTKFVERESKLTGARFVQTLVLGVLQHPAPSLTQLTEIAADLGVAITNQGLEERCTERAAALLRGVLEAAVGQVIAAAPVAIPVLRRFAAVVVQDCTIVPLPDDLAAIWQGTGNQTGQGRAAVKVGVRLDLLTGGLGGPRLDQGRTHDQRSAIAAEPLAPGSLRVADLGFFSLGDFQRLDAAGVYVLSRYKVGTTVFDGSGQPLDLRRWLGKQGPALLDQPVWLGQRHRLPMRLLAEPVPEVVANERRRKLRATAKRKGQTVSQDRRQLAGWTILVTNAPPALLSGADALVVARARWQIELLFKLWKSHGQLGRSRSEDKWRVLCEFYATLVAVVLQHWVILVGVWSAPDRSLTKAAQVVRDHVVLLAAALRGRLPLTAALAQIQDCLAVGGRMNPRKQHPNTYQLLLRLGEVSLDLEEAA